MCTDNPVYFPSCMENVLRKKRTGSWTSTGNKMPPRAGERLPQLILWNTVSCLGLGYMPARGKHNRAGHFISHPPVVATALQRSLGGMSTPKAAPKKAASARSADTLVDEKASDINYSQRKKEISRLVSQVEFGVVSCPRAWQEKLTL